MSKKPKDAMTDEQFVAAIEKVGIPSIVGAAPYIGISRRQTQRIAAGNSPVPGPVSKLLRVVIKHKIDAEELLEL